MKRYLLIAPANPQMRLLTVDMLSGPTLAYRGDLTLIGQAGSGHEAIPRDRAMLCIDTDEGSIYRPEGDGTVTFLGSILEHMLSRPVKNAVFHGDAVPLLFETRDPTLLTRAMQRAEVSAQDIKDALYGKAIRVFEPTLARIVCETLRIVCDASRTALKHGEHPSVCFDRILSSVHVQRTEQEAAA
jgi:hypothetical protein